MTIEEKKAMAYDEALKDMRVIYPNLSGDAKLAIEHAFPQLKESEDEKFRKYILKGCKECIDANDRGFGAFNGYNRKISFLPRKTKRTSGKLHKVSC